MGTVYETDLLIKAHHGSMHPGGLRLTDRAVRLAGLTEGMHVADIGCGTGATAAFLKEKYRFSMVGLDSSDTLVAYGLKNHPGLNLIRWDGGTLPFEDGNRTLLFECTSIIGNTRQTLAQAAKALKMQVLSSPTLSSDASDAWHGRAHPKQRRNLPGPHDTGYKISCRRTIRRRSDVRRGTGKARRTGRLFISRLSCQSRASGWPVSNIS